MACRATTPPLRRLTLGRARSLVHTLGRAGQLHRQGHDWVSRWYLPSLRALAASSRSADRRVAAHGYRLLGDVHDLNGAPRAALRAFQKSVRLAPSAEAWRSSAAMYENMGELESARRALLRARLLAPDHELVELELERVEWALFNDCPALYHPGSISWAANEAIASGHYRRALEMVARKRSIKARQLRARAYGARGSAADVVREWTALARSKGSIQLAHADWFYALQGPAGNRPELWRALLWGVRPRLDGGSFGYSESLWSIDVSSLKRFELYARFRLAACERNVAALLALAHRFPGWHEPRDLAERLTGGVEERRRAAAPRLPDGG